jgi:hypothetical protein
MSRPARRRYGSVPAERASPQRQIRSLLRIELDARPVGFEHGMLLFEQREGGGPDWHVVLLRVPPKEMPAPGTDEMPECAVAAETVEGETLAGRARIVPFRAATDCLRLVGTSPLDRSG